MEPWAAEKELQASMALPPAPVRVPSQRSFAPDVASVTSVANNSDNEMVPEFLHRSTGICLTTEDNPGKL